MPGYLGTQRQFHDRFGKPILASRDAKASSKEQEEGLRTFLLVNFSDLLEILLQFV